MGVWRGYATAGVPPSIMGIGPAVAIPKVLQQLQLNTRDIDVYEINEAFASQALWCCRELNLDMKKVNPNGGAIALGHPLGCTGARMVATLLYELHRQQRQLGVVSMCIGTGMGAAAVIAGGHLTDVPTESTYSGVVSMSDVGLLVFLAELNQLELWGADIASAYLLAETDEKVFIIADAAFGDREGYILIIFKAQYGLRTSGVRWHDKLFDVLTSLGFTPSKIPDVWMRRNTNKHGVEIWEYIATYVDDLLMAMVNPKEFVDKLESEPWYYKLKGGPLEFHLGCGFERDKDGTLKWIPRKYIERLCDTYKRLFGEEPRIGKSERSSPLAAGDHPELDDSELLDPAGTTTYQTLVGSQQWLITIGRFDIAVAVMTMSRFSQAPRIGHLERVKRDKSRSKRAVTRD